MTHPAAVDAHQDLAQASLAGLGSALAGLLPGEPVTGPTTVGTSHPDLPLGTVAVTATLSGALVGTVVVAVWDAVGAALVSDRPSLTAALEPLLGAAAAASDGAQVSALRELPAEQALAELPRGLPTATLLLRDIAGPVGLLTLVLQAAGTVTFTADSVSRGGGFSPDLASAGSAYDDLRGSVKATQPDVGATRAAAGGGSPPGFRRLELLREVELDVTAELGRTRMLMRELLALVPGAVVELDRLAGSPVDLLVNGTRIARGEVVVVDENFAVRITEIVEPDADGAAPRR